MRERRRERKNAPPIADVFSSLRWPLQASKDGSAPLDRAAEFRDQRGTSAGTTASSGEGKGWARAIAFVVRWSKFVDKMKKGRRTKKIVLRAVARPNCLLSSPCRFLLKEKSLALHFERATDVKTCERGDSIAAGDVPARKEKKKKQTLFFFPRVHPKPREKNPLTEERKKTCTTEQQQNKTAPILATSQK